MHGSCLRSLSLLRRLAAATRNSKVVALLLLLLLLLNLSWHLLLHRVHHHLLLMLVLGVVGEAAHILLRSKKLACIHELVIVAALRARMWDLEHVRWGRRVDLLGL